MLRKFDALTVRDAYTDIEIYQRFYGEGGLGFDSYMISNELKFTLLPGRKFAKIERKDHVCPVNVGVKKWTRRYLLSKQQSWTILIDQVVSTEFLRQFQFRPGI